MLALDATSCLAASAVSTPAVILPRIRQYGPAELADVARVYSRCGLNPEAPPAAGREGEAGGSGGGGGVSLFDALAAQTVARIQGADIQNILRWVGRCLG
jgi:hypothetical protein